MMWPWLDKAFTYLETLQGIKAIARGQMYVCIINSESNLQCWKGYGSKEYDLTTSVLGPYLDPAVKVKDLFMTGDRDSSLCFTVISNNIRHCFGRFANNNNLKELTSSTSNPPYNQLSEAEYAMTQDGDVDYIAPYQQVCRFADGEPHCKINRKCRDAEKKDTAENVFDVRPASVRPGGSLFPLKALVPGHDYMCAIGNDDTGICWSCPVEPRTQAATAFPADGILGKVRSILTEDEGNYPAVWAVMMDKTVKSWYNNAEKSWGKVLTN